MPTDKILAALADPSTTYWLRDALKSSLPRDPVDALHDAEALSDLLRERYAGLDASAAHRLRMIAADVDRVLNGFAGLDAIDRDTLQAAYTAIRVVERNLDDKAAGSGLD